MTNLHFEPLCLGLVPRPDLAPLRPRALGDLNLARHGELEEVEVGGERLGEINWELVLDLVVVRVDHVGIGIFAVRAVHVNVVGGGLWRSGRGRHCSSSLGGAGGAWGRDGGRLGRHPRDGRRCIRGSSVF